MDELEFLLSDHLKKTPLAEGKILFGFEDESVELSGYLDVTVLGDEKTHRVKIQYYGCSSRDGGGMISYSFRSDTIDRLFLDSDKNYFFATLPKIAKSS